ncbi:MAG: hypothetical protein JWN78_3048, partial [Bacteroidota bacterium]|nr:hypothetical protein [Bacteroidota bacterium]
CPGATTAQTAGLPTGSTFPTGTTTNTFTVTDAGGLTASCSFTVTITDSEAPVIICPADTTVNVISGCTATGLNLGIPTTTDNCGVASVTNNHPGTTYPPGNTIVTWTVTDSAGNTATCNQTVTIVSFSPTISSNSPVCEGENLILTASDIPGATLYTWYGPLNNVIGTTTLPTLTVLAVTTAEAGSYSVTVTVNSCTSTKATTIAVIKPKPTAPTLTAVSPVCERSSIVFCAATADTGVIYNWYGPAGFQSNSNCVTLTNVTPAQSGFYTVVTTLNGCRSLADSVFILVQPAPQSDSIGSNSPLCEHQTLQLFDSVRNPNNIDFNWTGPNGFTSNQQNPSLPNVTLVNQGFYTVVLTERGTSCTSLPYTTLVEINAFPDSLAANNTGPVCEGNTITLNATNIFGAVYLWTGPNGFTAIGKNPVLTSVTPDMSGIYTVIVALPGGCIDSAKTNVIVYPNPIVDAGIDTTITQGTLLQLHGTLLDNFGNEIPFPLGTTYNWSPNAILDHDYIPDPMADFSDLPVPNPYKFIFMIRDEHGCRGTDSIYVTVLPSFGLVIPDIISPNGDGLNDTWKLTFIDNFNLNNIPYLIQIFARGGALIYSSSNYSNTDGFDGTFNGTALPSGAYWYIITTPGKSYKGAIHIIR